MKNNDTQEYFLSTDPYAACGKIPFANPYPSSHSKYAAHQNRHSYQPYDGKTNWISLLGFVKQTPSAETPAEGYQMLSSIIGTVPFVAGEKLTLENLMVPVP